MNVPALMSPVLDDGGWCGTAFDPRKGASFCRTRDLYIDASVRVAPVLRASAGLHVFSHVLSIVSLVNAGTTSS